jgi:hypothetical protein
MVKGNEGFIFENIIWCNICVSLLYLVSSLKYENSLFVEV